ncbi:MAG: FecR family protein [Burkholderiales bacterium]
MALGLVLMCAAAHGQAPESEAATALRLAGTVEFASGDSMITPQVGDSRLVAKGSEVHEGDTIVTFEGGEAQLHMLDGAYLMVRENSRIKIEAYVADGGDKDRSILDLIKGTVRSITGWIGKYNRAAYEIRTPILVTIGVRGTDHEVTYIPPGDPRGEPGVYDKVNEGKAFMRLGSEVVEVPPQRAVFSAWGAIPHRPRLLASIPAFFKPGPHERQFAQRARASLRTIAAQRQARIRAVRELRGIGPRGAASERRQQLRPGVGAIRGRVRAGGALRESGARARQMQRRAPREREPEKDRPRMRRRE